MIKMLSNKIKIDNRSFKENLIASIFITTILDEHFVISSSI